MDLMKDALQALKPEIAAPAYAPGAAEALDIGLRDGRRYALPYRGLLLVTYDPSSGLRLRHSLAEVFVDGAGLEPLYRELIAQNVREITEDDGSQLGREFDQPPENAPWIREIRVEERPA
jgi:hypothetical protein